MRLEVRPAKAPDGSTRVLLECDEWHVLVWPEDALALAAALVEAAETIRSIEPRHGSSR